MKNLFSAVLCITFSQLTYSQQYISNMSDDSSRIVELKELTIKSLQKTTQQKLIAFYKANNAATLEEIMSRLPEISLLRRGSYGMEPAIRSYSAGQINLLVDGMRIHGACTDKMDPASIYIEPMNLEHLQVQTGVTGFLNGSTIGGTINFKLAEPSFEGKNKISGVVHSGFQSAAKSFYEAMQLNYSFSNWAIKAGATYRKSHNYRSGSGETINFSQYEKANYSLSVKHRLTSDVFIKADLLTDDGWNIGYPALPMDVGYASARIASISIEQKTNTRKWEQWKAKLYANKVRHFMDDTKRPNVSMHMDMPGKSTTYGGFFEGELKLAGKNRLQLKADASSNYLKASMTMYQPGQLPMYMLTWPDNRRDQIGIAASLLLPLDSSARLQINTRTDFINNSLLTNEAKSQLSILGYTSSEKTKLLKNLSVQLYKTLNKNVKITSALSFTERAGTASELYGFYLFNSSDGYDYIGNPNLNNESSFQGEITGVFNLKNSKLQVTAFYNRINNYIIGIINSQYSTMTNGARGVKVYNNIGAAHISGFEITASAKPINRIELIATLKYNYGIDNKKQPLPFISPLKNISSIRYLAGRFSFQLESEVSAKQTRFDKKSGEDLTYGYTLLNARFGYLLQIFKKELQIQSGVENFLDQKYHDHLDWGNIPRPGRNLYLQLKYFF
ncbi:MAG: TonB-dependent receptor [Chitinophagaceae bacterium]|jgi:iron complex outermembrane receptor protein